MSKKITKEQLYKDVNRYMEYQSEMYCMYSDIVNNRNLNPVAFFKYIYDNYESLDFVKKTIEKMENDGLISLAYNLKIIIDYKEAILMNNKNTTEKLEPEFKKINNVRSTLDKNDIRSSCYYAKKKKLEEDSINLVIDDYLKQNDECDDYEYMKLIYKISNHIKDVDNEKYIRLIDRKYNINKIDKKEIDELIEILEYFLKNLKANLWEFEIYYYIFKTNKKEYEKLNKRKNKTKVKDKIERVESIINLYSNKIREELTDIKVNDKNPELVICNCKIVALRNMIKEYSKLLNELIILKDKLNSNNINGVKIPPVKINDDYILSIVNEIKTLLKGYNDIMGVSIKRKNEIKEEFLKKYVYDSRD